MPSNVLGRVRVSKAFKSSNAQSGAVFSPSCNLIDLKEVNPPLNIQAESVAGPLVNSSVSTVFPQPTERKGPL